MRSGQFFQGPERWTERREEALAFQHGDEALRCVCEQNLQEVELLLAFPDRRPDLQIPINRTF